MLLDMFQSIDQVSSLLHGDSLVSWSREYQSIEYVFFSSHSFVSTFMQFTVQNANLSFAQSPPEWKLRASKGDDSCSDEAYALIRIAASDHLSRFPLFLTYC